jgi:hypothetical protein
MSRCARPRWQRSLRAGGENDHLRRLQESPMGVRSSVIRKNHLAGRLQGRFQCGGHGSSFFSLPARRPLRRAA